MKFSARWMLLSIVVIESCDRFHVSAKSDTSPGTTLLPSASLGHSHPFFPQNGVRTSGVHRHIKGNCS